MKILGDLSKRKKHGFQCEKVVKRWCGSDDRAKDPKK
jgi:hypothetical protein